MDRERLTEAIVMLDRAGFQRPDYRAERQRLAREIHRLDEEKMARLGKEPLRVGEWVVQRAA